MISHTKEVTDQTKNMYQQKQTSKKEKVLIAVVLSIIAISTMWLFYNQATANYFSDLELHIKYAIDENTANYSINSLIIKFIYTFFGHIGIASFLTIIVLLNIIITKKVLELYTPCKNSITLWIYAVLLNFVIAIHLQFNNHFWIVGVQEPNEWHNSTYLFMKLIGMLVILLYFEIKGTYLNKIETKNYIFFVILLILVNAIKPNFILAFAPTMFVFLVIDFFHNIKNKKAILHIFIFGIAVLISLSVLLFQKEALYSDGTNSVAIGLEPFRLLSVYNKFPILAILQSAAFPIFMYATNIKTVLRDERMRFILLFNVVAFAEYIFLYEKGTRMVHGNFEWGYNFALMIAFISSIPLLEYRKSNTKNYLYSIIAYTLLVLHAVHGLIYFALLLCGKSYY